MVQFYFLAIFINLIAGLYFSNKFFIGKCPSVANLVQFLDNKISKVIFAILAGFTAIFKIISVYNGDVPVVGDLFVVISLFIISLYFFHDLIVKSEKAEIIDAEVIQEETPVVSVESVAEKKEAEEHPVEEVKAEEVKVESETENKCKSSENKLRENYSKFYSTAEKFKTALGIIFIIIAVLHFCFPNIVLV